MNNFDIIAASLLNPYPFVPQFFLLIKNMKFTDEADEIVLIVDNPLFASTIIPPESKNPGVSAR